jgi:vacuolar-type H+-ATPase subunit F/Vma7
MKLFKLIILIFTLGFFTNNIQAQEEAANAIDKYFQKYIDDERFTVVYISPKLFQLIGKLDLDGIDMEDDEAQAMMDMVEDLRGLRILVSDQDSKALYKEAKQKIDTKEYEILMTVRDKDGDNVDFLVKDQDDGDIINELLLMVGGEEDFVLMSFVGKISLSKISDLAKTMDDYDDDDDDDDNDKNDN